MRLRTEMTLLQTQHREAAAATERDAQAMRDAAQAYQLFEARVRSGAAALRDDEARALREATFAHQMFEASVRSGVQAMREQEAAERAAAAARDDLAARTQRLVASISPAAAAQSRFNREIAEARLLINAGSISLDQYAAKLRLEHTILDTTNAAFARGATSVGAHRQAMMGASYQAQDFFTQVSMGANPLNAFAVQSAQLAGQFANIEGKAGAVARFMMGPWGLAITGAIMIMSMFTKGLFEGASAAETKAKAAKDLKDSIDALERSTRAAVDTEWDQQRAVMASALALRQKALDTRAATLEEIAHTRAKLASALADSARPDPNRGQDGGMDFSLTQAGILEGKIKGLDKQLADQEASLKKTDVAFRNAQMDIVGSRINANLDATAGATRNYEKQLSAINAEFRKSGDVEAYARARQKVEKSYAAEQEAIRKLRKDESAADRAAAAETKRLEKLGRENDAVEAQIRNHSRLAEAYGKSGGAALIAEARLKAESDAIKKRADIETLVDQQVRLSIADRVSSVEQGNAALREQVKAQRDVNAQVAAGLVPAERAADMVRDRIDDLPLLAAIEAAQQRGLAIEAASATRALEDQRKERERLRLATVQAQFNTSVAGARDRLVDMREELRLIGETDEARGRALATIRAQRETAKLPSDTDPALIADYIRVQGDIGAQTAINAQAQRAYNETLTFAAEQWDAIAQNVDNAARGMADAFGSVGQAIGEMASVYANYHATAARLETERDARILAAGKNQASIDKANARYAVATATSQIGLFGDMTKAAKGYFKEGSTGYKTLETAEKAFRAIEFALSIKAMAQDAIETGTSIANSVARTATAATEAVVNAIKSLPFPLNLAAGAATIAALAAIGVSVAGSFGGGKNTLAKANDGSGTVLGDSSAQSESIKRSIDALKEVDTLTMNTSRDMLATLRSIDANIGGLASLLVRTGNIDASGGVETGFKANAVGSILGSVPVIGGILKGLFGTSTKVVGSGLYGGAQSLDDILSGGFDASYYSDVQKKKKLFGLTTSTKYSTSYTGADSEIESQFTLLLRQFYTAIGQASGPLGENLNAVQQRLAGFTVDIGKIDLQGLTGTEIEEKLQAVFGAAADDMAQAAMPGLERFQQVGEGYFETMVRVASTVEVVTSAFALLGRQTSAMGIDVNMAVAGMFESVSDFASASQAYFETYYSKEEQTSARAAQMAGTFTSLGLAMPATLEAFRALIEAQNLTTTAGQSTYATLLQLAPAFADLQESMTGAKSAADVLSERQDLERKMLELQGNTAAIRALDLAKIDASNRALQQQIYAIQDAQEAARAADELRKAWTSVGDSIMDEVDRIRGITGAGQNGSFAALLGQFNAANTAARGGDQDAAKSLPGLSQAMLKAAELVATSRQELDRVQAQTAASLEATYDAISALMGSNPVAAADTLAAAATAAQATSTTAANDDMASEIKALREEVAAMRNDNNAGHALTASNTGAMKRTLDDVTAASGGDAISITGVAA